MEDRSNKLKEELSCPICLDILKDPSRVIVCGHRFCKSCIEKCFHEAPKKQCPCCRKEIPTRRHIYEDSKFKTVLDIIKQYMRPIHKKKHFKQSLVKSNQIRVILQYDPRYPLASPFLFRDLKVSLDTPIEYLREYVKGKIKVENDMWEDFLFLFFAQDEDMHLISIDNESLTIKQIKQIYPDTHSSMIFFLTPKIA